MTYLDRITLNSLPSDTRYSAAFWEVPPLQVTDQPAAVGLTFSWQGQLPGQAGDATPLMIEDMAGFLEAVAGWLSTTLGVTVEPRGDILLMGVENRYDPHAGS